MEPRDLIFSFILCVNNEELLHTSKEFIERLPIPQGYQIEIIEIRNAVSIASGYNEGMKRAKGKIKVYLHQDVYLVHPQFLQDILLIFQNPAIGMIGVAGAAIIPESYIWWESPITIGMTYEIRNAHMRKLAFFMPKETYTDVALLDGLLLVTQYDLKWREDILDGWHFYDCSQCLEFKKAGYRIVVPYQISPWTIHDCGYVSVEGYEHYRQVVINNYS